MRERQRRHAPAGEIELPKKAQRETQFSKAIVLLSEVSAIPALLQSDGQNPLALLHDALSEGIHALSDQECLERAQEAEVVFCAIVDRMQMALTEQKTLKSALSDIAKRKTQGGKAVYPNRWSEIELA